MSGNGDFVSWLQDILAQASHGERMGIPQFCAPMFDATLVIRHVEENAAMRVGPNPFGYSSLQCDHLFRVIGHTRSVVCREGGARHDAVSTESLVEAIPTAAYAGFVWLYRICLMATPISNKVAREVSGAPEK